MAVKQNPLNTDETRIDLKVHLRLASFENQRA